MPDSGVGPHLTPGEVKIQLLREGLPTPLFRTAVRLLFSGQTASITTNWILMQYDHGQNEWRYETLQPLVGALHARVQGWLSFPMRELAPEWLKDMLNETGDEENL
jgi:hypothetical protein